MMATLIVFSLEVFALLMVLGMIGALAIGLKYIYNEAKKDGIL